MWYNNILKLYIRNKSNINLSNAYFKPWFQYLLPINLQIQKKYKNNSSFISTRTFGIKSVEQSSVTEHEAMSIDERLDSFESFLATKPSTESVVAYYDKFGKDYEAAIHRACGDEDSFVFPEVRSRFPDINLRILDVCAGTGMLGEELHEHGYLNVDALDGNATLLGIARAKCVYVNLYHEFIGTDALKSVELESYDLVLCAGSFYEFHLEGRHLKAVLSACKKGGFFVFTSYPVDDESNTKVTSIVREMEKEGLIRIEKNEIIPHKYWKDENVQKLFILQKL